MRVAYVLSIFPKLSETFIAGELAALRGRGVELRILSLRPPREELRHPIVAQAGLDRLTSYEPAQFSRILEDFRPQLLHAHFATESTATAMELAAEHELPFTFTAHGYDIHRKPPPDFAARAAAARAVVTVSAANAEYIANAFGVPRGHIRVIPCGVDTESFRPLPTQGASEPASPAIQGGDPVILCVARHVKVKNLDVLLEACAALRRRGTRFRCIMLGDGPARAGLEATRARLGLQDVVEMPGAAHQGEVLECWRRASVGVLTSENEGMPVSLMEAAACGVPVVATRVGGVPELVEDGVTGLLTPPGDAHALASALDRCLRDARLRSRLGAAARARAEERFTVTHQLEQLLQLWKEVLAP